jgi:hypothetical protein
MKTSQCSWAPPRQVQPDFGHVATYDVVIVVSAERVITTF